MINLKKYRFVNIFVVLCFMFAGSPGFASDTCMFMITADDVPPNIVFLLDNGAEMEQIVWHATYSNEVDYTPFANVADQCDVVGSAPGVVPPTPGDTLVLTGVDETTYPFAVGADVEGVTSGATANVVTRTYSGAELHLEIDSQIGTFQVAETVRRYQNVNNIAFGTLSSIQVPPPPAAGGGGCPAIGYNGFYNELGYGVINHGGTYFLVKVLNTLLLDLYTNGFPDTDGAGTFVIEVDGVNKTITLPPLPSAAVDGDGVKDNATGFRYSKNYLNWLFFAKDAGGSSLYAGNGSDLPAKSRFYYAKKALLNVGKLAANRAKFSIFNFANDEGASSVQPLGLVVTIPLAADPANNILDPNFVNNINNMGTVAYSPLAEGLSTIGGYFNSSSSGLLPAEYCQKNFAIVVTPGMSSEDQTDQSSDLPATLEDFDNDAGGIGEGELKADDSDFSYVPNSNGSSWLDDVAYYMYTNDMVSYITGFQNVTTYTVGFMGDRLSNLFLINTSNNGNGNENLYTTTNSEYGKYHYVAEDPNGLANAIMDAVNDILSQTSTFTAPVVPVTRTTSSNRIYMALFKPVGGTFWEGNVVKFGIDANLQVVDADGNVATYPNGAIMEDAVPYWKTIDWASADYSNYMDNRTGLTVSRKIYTYLGTTTDLTHADNAFETGNALLTPQIMGNPPSGVGNTINYVRGADVQDEDSDGLFEENRRVITGDVLHSEPLVFTYNYSDHTATTLVFFGSNGGMLHAVLDAIDPDVDTADDETNYGTEAWGYIPPQQLHRLKNFLDGANHIDFIDSSPKVYFKDVDHDGLVDTGDGDRVILVCGERKGGTSYFALDVTDPYAPVYLWRINNYYDNLTGTVELSGVSGDWTGAMYADHFTNNDFVSGAFDGHFCVNGNLVGNTFQYDCLSGDIQVGDKVFAYKANAYDDGAYATVAAISEDAPFATGPTSVIAELGESWSEPQFGMVKTFDGDTTGTPVFFIGGGYSSTQAAGRAVIAIDALNGTVVKTFINDGVTITDMDYSIASTVRAIDENNNGFVDKVYVGDLGGQMWRIGQFATDALGNPLAFFQSDENIHRWTAHVLLRSDSTYTRKFFYPPSVTLERGYDLVFIGSGDREDACSYPGDGTDTRDPIAHNTAERICVVKDFHSSDTWTEADLVDVTDPTDPVPDLNSATSDVDGSGNPDQGWYLRLVDIAGEAVGEKVLAEGTIFYKALYITTFTPNDDPCQPGGAGTIYGLQYKTGGAVVDWDKSDASEVPQRSYTLGGGIPSKAVTVITETGEKLFISVGSTNPEPGSLSVEAGIIALDPSSPAINFFYLWWREL